MRLAPHRARLLSLAVALAALLSLLAQPGIGAPAAEEALSDAEQCSQSFLDLKGRWFYTCPPGCLGLLAAQWQRSLSTRSAVRAPPAVYGRYPYDEQSAVCLAAIHSGAIDESKGGAVGAIDFMPQDWSNSSSQTIFPYDSWQGSYSHGVQSQEVPAERRPLPSPLSSLSWRVDSRGVRWWRRVAPFSPRGGHAQVSDYQAQLHSVSVQLSLVVGGRNATHRLNDVWLLVESTTLVGSINSVGRWRRLPDAPFSPRSDAIAYMVNNDTAYRGATFVYVVGGQTADACGLTELGVCSNEVWRAWLNTNETLDVDELRLTWTTVDAPHALLPFPARCDAAFDSGLPNAPSVRLQLLVAGGQLSYNDSTCSSAPLYTNDVWYSALHVNDSSWRRAADAPWSPRRGQQSDRLTVAYPFHAALLGGLRYLNVSFDPALNRSRLTSAVLHADVWMCRVLDELDECQFGWPVGANETLPVASLPFARAGNNFFTQTDYPVVGGVVSAASAQRWKTTLPKEWTPVTWPPPYNVTVMTQRTVGDPEDNSTWPSRQQQDDDRFGLPWSAVVGEAELNDPEGSFALGSEWVVHTDRLPPVKVVEIVPYEMAGVMTDSPADPSPFLYQAASAENTTRALFDFSLRRLEHRGGSSLFPLISGGRSGLRFFNDWVVLAGWGGCASVDDPSFARVIGNVSIIGPSSTYSSVMIAVRVQCADASHHWEPPSPDPQVDLFCTNAGVWMDLDHFTIRRCVANALHCIPPLRDDGLGGCQMPAAVIASIDIDFIDGIIGRVDDITLSALPLNRMLELTVRGAFFQQPLTVTVGGQDCLIAQLLLGNESLSLCSNRSHNATTSSPVDCTYADALTCLVESVYGQRLPVRVWSGPLFESADVVERFAGRVATVSSALPRLLNVTSTACQTPPSSHLRLVECPITEAFDVDVWLDGHSVLQSTLSVTEVLLDSLTPLQCAGQNATRCPFEANHPCVVVRCRVFPRFGEHLLRAANVDDHMALTLSEEATSLSFQSCAAGSRNDYEAVMRGSASSLCIPCSPGYSTINGTNQGWCTACLPGSFAAVEGSATCQPCPEGSFSDEVGATRCRNCSVNSWQHFPGQDRCDVCDLDTYIVYDRAFPSTESTADSTTPLFLRSAHCLACPFRAQCAMPTAQWTRTGRRLSAGRPGGGHSALGALLHHRLRGCECAPAAF